MSVQAQQRNVPAHEYEQQAGLILVERLSREGWTEEEIVREVEQFTAWKATDDRPKTSFLGWIRAALGIG